MPSPFAVLKKNRNPDLTRDLETRPLLEQASSDDEEILIKSAPNPTRNPLLQQINRVRDLWNKLPDSWLVKGGILLLSIIFTPLGLALSLALMLVLLALTFAALVLLTAVALIATPIKWIIGCFSPKKIEPLVEHPHLNALDHTNAGKKIEENIKEASEITPLLSKDNEYNKATQSPAFFRPIRHRTGQKETEEADLLYQNHDCKKSQ